VNKDSLVINCGNACNFRSCYLEAAVIKLN